MRSMKPLFSRVVTQRRVSVVASKVHHADSASTSVEVNGAAPCALPAASVQSPTPGFFQRSCKWRLQKSREGPLPASQVRNCAGVPGGVGAGGAGTGAGAGAGAGDGGVGVGTGVGVGAMGEVFAAGAVANGTSPASAAAALPPPHAVNQIEERDASARRRSGSKLDKRNSLGQSPGGRPNGDSHHRRWTHPAQSRWVRMSHIDGGEHRTFGTIDTPTMLSIASNSDQGVMDERD